jgi:hypothetical protein
MMHDLATIDPRSARARVLLRVHCVHMYMRLTQTNIAIMLMLLFAARTVKLFATRQGISNIRHFHFDDSHRLTTPKWKMVKRIMTTPNVNIPPGWTFRMLTVKNHREHGTCHQNPEHMPLKLFIHRYSCRRAVPPPCINANVRTAPVTNKTTTKSARRRTTLPTPRLRRLSSLLQMSDMLALREHMRPVKKQEHTVRNY